MGVFSQGVVHLRDVLVPRAQAPDQAGLFDGQDPASYNGSDPIRLWVIQLVIIMGMTQLLALIFGRIKQPRVIAEVIGGVLLGPSVMGRIPHFSQHIFPTQSIPLLNLTANIALVLFLFLIGLEIDFTIVRRNFKASASISAAGLIVPLGLGAALGVPIYNVFTDKTVNFGYFLLFVAVAIGITAFPVLCRILTATRLLDTTVGAVTLAAGVGNDVVGWILLALTVALVNSGNGITALYVLLTAVGFVIFLTIPVRLAYRWIARVTGSLETGQPTALMMTITFVVVFGSAFFTDVIGIHAIFGGFLAGLIIPHDNGFAITIVEKLEDVVCILLLPLYFALSGLSTNLGLLDNGITWGYTILICVVAFFSKFLACSITAKIFGFNLRESGAIGALMSCKGLVELIVLNVGLSAGILDTRTFSMFVLHAIILTFMTTPLTLLIYPSKYHVHEGTSRQQALVASQGGTDDVFAQRSGSEHFRTRFTVVLDRIEQLPAAMTLTQLLQSPFNLSSPRKSVASSVVDEKTSVATLPPGLPSSTLAQPSEPTVQSRHVAINALRLIELTERTSAVFKSQTTETLIRSDPVLSIFRTFGALNRMIVSTALSVIGFEEFPTQISTYARDTASEMIIVPWNLTASTDESQTSAALSSSGPFDGIFLQKRDEDGSFVYSQFIRNVFAKSPSDVALIVDRGASQSFDGGHACHLFLPFFGGADDRLALSFVVQLCLNPSISATVIKIKKSDTPTDETNKGPKTQDAQDVTHTVTFPDTFYGSRDTETRLASEVADNLAWARYTSTTSPPAELVQCLSRVDFREESHSRPLFGVVDAATRLSGEHSQRRLLFVVGRSRRSTVDQSGAELRELFTERGTSLGSDVSKSLGDVGAALVASTSNESLVVLQAGS